MDLMLLHAIAGTENTAIRDAIVGELKNVWSSVPGIVEKDSDGHIATVKSAVKQLVTDVDGTRTNVEMPLLDTSPVHYPGGGGVSHTHPVKRGDEGLVILASMAQDLWHKNGDVQDPVDNRRHHLSDSRWLPGGRSDPRALDPPASTSSQQNRSDDGNHVVDVHPQNGLTHSSTAKHLVIVGGSSGSGTLHLPDGGGGGSGAMLLSGGGDGGKIIKNAAKVLINCIKQSPLPDPGSSFANKKLIATTPVGAVGSASSAVGGAMSGLLSGGASTLFANPIAGQAGALQSAISSAISSIGGMGGAGGLASSLNGLSGALGGLTSGASALSGATSPAAGESGLDALLAHATSLTTYFGSAPAPSSVALASATAPLLSGPSLTSITAQLNALIAQVVAGTVTPAAAAATVDGWASQTGALVPASSSAIATLADAAPLLDLGLATASHGNSLDPREQAAAAAVSTPALASLTAAIGNLFGLSGADMASAMAFPDAAATQPGATGGM